MEGCCRRSSRNEGEVRILGMREGRQSDSSRDGAGGGRVRGGLESIVSGQHVFSSAVGLQGFCGVDILRQLRFASHHRPLLPLLVLQLGRDGARGQGCSGLLFHDVHFFAPPRPVCGKSRIHLEEKKKCADR